VKTANSTFWFFLFLAHPPPNYSDSDLFGFLQHRRAAPHTATHFVKCKEIGRGGFETRDMSCAENRESGGIDVGTTPAAGNVRLFHAERTRALIDPRNTGQKTWLRTCGVYEKLPRTGDVGAEMRAITAH